MNGIGIATFALRLAAIYVWIQSLLQLFAVPWMATLSDENLGRASLIGYCAALLLEAIFGTILWFTSSKLAGWILGAEGDRPLRGSAELGGLAFRLAGVWLLDRAIHETWNVFFQVKMSSLVRSPAGLIGEIAVFLILGSTAAALIFGGGRLARRMFPSAEPATSIARQLQPIAFSVLGLVLLMNALPPLAANLALWKGWSESGHGFETTSTSAEWPVYLASFLRVVLGLGLFFSGRPLVRAWHWAQTAGLDRGRSAEPRAPSGAPHA